VTGRDGIVVMGAAGSGKTTVGRLLAERLAGTFIDADDFHSPSAVAAMEAGRSLADADREPWLDEVARAIVASRAIGMPVVACSALRVPYRERLRSGAGALAFVHLTGDADLIRDRMLARAGHFMPAGMLPSQLATLEPLQDSEAGATFDIDAAPDEIVARITDWLDIHHLDGKASPCIPQSPS
jgi:gluconokinase